MPNYLFFDLQGVLDGIFSYNTPSTDDLVLENLSDHVFRILPHGIECITLLQQLINHHDYQLVFQSRNALPNQLHLLEQLKTAAFEKGMHFPPVMATAISDAVYHPYLSSDTPEITRHENGMLIGKYGITLPNKKCVRAALASMLHITEKERHHHVVLDDSDDVVKEALAEGYRAYLIGETPPAMSLVKALQAVNSRL